MKLWQRVLPFFLMALLACATAYAELDESVLTDGLACTVQLDTNGIDMVIRPDNQPYVAVCEDASHEMIVYVDFVEMPNLNGTFLRLTCSLVSGSMTDIDTLRVDASSGSWIFDTSREVSEYDDMYYEDYAVLLGTDGMAMMKALAKKDLPLTLTLEGDHDCITAALTLPSEDMKLLYGRFVSAGGMEQDFTLVD